MLAVLTAAPFLCSAQEKSFVPPSLPQANWRLIESHQLPLSIVSNYGEEPAIEDEYGVKAAELRTYGMSNGAKIQVLVESAPDPSSAYGLFTVYETPVMTPVEGVALASGDSQQTLMARGSRFIRFLRSTGASVSNADYRALLLFVGGAAPSAAALAALPHPLPTRGLVPGSEKYLLGLAAAKRVLPDFRTDLIGFDQGAEVQLGSYRRGDRESIFVSINYPNPQIARVRYGSMTKLLGLNQDGQEDSVYGRREDSYVFLVLHAGSKQVAASFLDQFKVAQSVSWDQKPHSERAFTLSLVHMILAILLLTLILAAACVVAGILFFLSRRVAAKFFPQSQWGRSDEDQLIRLNLKT